MAPPPRRLPCALLAALLLATAAPTPASAEIYRWKDAAGREHFTTDLQKVPPEKRREAREAAKASRPAPNLNYHPTEVPPEDREEYTPPAEPTPAAQDPEAEAEAAEAASAKSACDALKKEAAALRDAIAWKERSVGNREDADSLYQEHRRKKNLAKAEAELEQAQAEYDRWRKRHRRRGAPPGCLR